MIVRPLMFRPLQIDRRLFARCLLGGAAGAWALGALMAGPARGEEAKVALAAHRAIYDLSLLEARGKQSLESVRGRILYDFTGSVCEGYALGFRQVTELTSEGKQSISDLRSTNWEEGTGKSFRFTTQNFLDGKATETAEGEAARVDGKTTVTLTKPAPKKLDAGDVIFPSDHMRKIVQAALAGKTLYEIGTYDGAENGERIYNSLTVIGKPIKPGAHAPDDAAAKVAALQGLTRWPVTISYFDRAKGESEQTPAYSISFELYDNGIARALKLDYGDFVLRGVMTSLEVRDSKPCP